MTLKSKLRDCRLTIGSWLMMANETAADIMSQVGFEWLVVDLEHTDTDLNTCRQLISTIQGNQCQALVRVSKNEEVIIKRVLDMGADGIIVPAVNSVNDAKCAVNYAKYPPLGTRGVGLFRAQGYGEKFKEYCDWVSNELVVIAQIEHISAVNNIDQIIDVAGIDGMIIGPYDLSASMGVPGMYHNREVKNAIEKVIASCRQRRFSVGFHVIETTPEVIKSRIDQGCNLLAYSMDYLFLLNKCKESLAALGIKAVQ